MLHYSNYLALEQILTAQQPESDRLGKPAHDEMLFIVIHQTYELWFKQVLHEINSVHQIMGSSGIDDNSPELQTVVHRLSRIVSILKVLVHQIDILETMTAMDFLDFRDLLRPASGFQSVQFKIIEARLGLKFEHRHGQAHYLSQLNPEEVTMIRQAEAERSVLTLVNAWLERLPFNDQERNWEEYRAAFMRSLAESEKENGAQFDQVFSLQHDDRAISPRAARAALFIFLYRGYPILQLPFQLLNNLLEIDEQLSNWRHRHMNMVHRMIGSRIGTGGSSGGDYLKAAADRHYIFKEIAGLMSFLMERKHLPPLSPELERRLGFVRH